MIPMLVPDETLRLECLKMAIQQDCKLPDATIESAERYYAFLKSGAKAE